MSKKVFTVQFTGPDGVTKDIELCVKKPDQKALQGAQKVHNKAFREAVDSGALLRPAINKVMREQHLWDDKREAEYVSIQEKLADNEKKLKRGGIPLSKGKEIAFEMQGLRARLREMLTERNQLDLYTAESLSENKRFGYLVSACTFENRTGKAFFKDYQDYLDREDEPATVAAATHMGRLLYDLDDDWQKKLPESQFLIKHKMVDDSLRLVDRDGHLIARDGRRINDEGYYINDKGEIIDKDGTRITEDGEYLIDELPFEDDLGMTKSEVLAA